MKEHLKLAQKAMAVLDQIEKSYGDPEDSYLSREKKKQIHDVGLKLFNVGGMDLMHSVCEAMRIARAKGETNLVNREIDISWHGIGDWQG